MKTKKLYVPISMTAALLGLITCAVSCAKKNSEPPKPLPAPPESLPTNSVPAPENTNAPAGTNTAAVETPAVTNAPVSAAAPVITNPPPAETTATVPEPISQVETNVPGHATVVEMPAAAPTAPTNFYPAVVVANVPTDDSSLSTLAPIVPEGNTNFFFRFRVGYDHINHGDNNDSYWLGAKFYAYGDGLRQQVGKNAWLIPDADAEFASTDIAKPDNNPHRGSDTGARFRADFTWPWFHWTPLLFARTNSVCPFCQPLTLGLGPTVNVGFDHLYDEDAYRFARYAGLRLTFNRSGFIEYTAGETEGLDGTRQQIVAELPFYQSRDGEVRYYFRGLWNHGESYRPDILEAGVFLEMPFTTLVRPDKWRDLIPCCSDE